MDLNSLQSYISGKTTTLATTFQIAGYNKSFISMTKSYKTTMKTLHLLIAGVMAGASLVSCNDDDGGEKVGTMLGLSIPAVAGAAGAPAWAVTDTVGIYCRYDDVSARNIPYVCSDGAASFGAVDGKDIFVKAATSLTAYYPFTGQSGVWQNPVINTLDQETTVDWLFARLDDVDAGRSSGLTMDMKHVMSLLRLSLITAGQKALGVTVSGLSHTGDFDTKTGVVSVADVPQDYVRTVTNGGLNEMELILLPQTAGNVGISVTTNRGKVYTASIPNLVLEPDRQYDYVFDLTVGEEPVVYLVPGSAVKWRLDGTVSDITPEDAAQ